MSSSKWTSGYKPRMLEGLPAYQCLPDFRGMRRGAVVVIGYGANRNRWVVQCDCGLYEYRTTRSLRRQNMNDFCDECDREYKEFKQSFKQQNGRFPDYFELPV